MAEKILKTRIQLKYDTLANWQKSTLALKKGEIAVAEIPTADPANKQLPPVMFKVGVDGEKTFKELNWASALAADVYDWAKAATKPSYTAAEVGADVSGSAATAETNAKAYVDEKIAAIPAQAEFTIETGETDGSLVLKKNGEAVGDPAVVKGWADLLTSIAAKYTKPEGGIPKSDLAEGVRGSLEKADSSVQSVALASGTNNGTLKLTVNGTATDNIAVKGLGSAAYTESGAYDAAGSAAAVLGESGDAVTKNTVYGAKAAAKAAQDTIDNYKTSNDKALADVKATADAAQTSAQVDTKISAHNSSAEAHSDIRQSITALAEKVSGRATAYVYKNKDDAAYTTAIGKAGSFVVGDTIYFTDAGISDEWVIKVNSETPYYEFQDIETEAPSFDGYVTGTGLTANKIVLGNGGSSVKAGTVGIATTLTANDDANLPTNGAVSKYVSSEIGKLSLAEVAVAAGETIKTISEANGKVSVEKQSIAIEQSQVNGLATALGGKQASLSEAQLAAVNSGITSAKVSQYDGYATGKQDAINAQNKLSAEFISGLGAAASKGVAETITASGTDLTTAKAVADYVAAQGFTKNVGTVTSVAAGTGLKVTGTASVNPTIEIDDAVEFILDCGTSAV